MGNRYATFVIILLLSAQLSYAGNSISFKYYSRPNETLKDVMLKFVHKDIYGLKWESIANIIKANNPKIKNWNNLTPDQTIVISLSEDRLIPGSITNM